MARTRTNYNKPDEANAESVSDVVVDKPVRIKKKSAPVRIRKGPGPNHPQVPGEFVDKGVYEVSEISDGWAKLANGKGWVSLEYVEKVD